MNHTVAQAAARLHISEAAIRSRCQRGTLENIRVGGRLYVIFPDESPINHDEAPTNTEVAGDESARYIALLESSLQQAHDETAHWRQQAETLGQLLDQQQRLSLADKVKDTPALADGDQAHPVKRHFLFWRW